MAAGPDMRTDTDPGADVDVVVVGGGNAGMAAALAAAERGRRVVLLEKGRRGEEGGNSFYTAGAVRLTHAGLEDLLPLLQPDDRHDRTTVPPYDAAAFRADMERVTSGRCDPLLTDVLIEQSRPTLAWLASHGVRWRLMYERQAYEHGGTWTFWGGLAVGTVDGGKGLIAQETAAVERLGVDVRYGCALTDLLMDGDRVRGVRYRDGEGVETELEATSVILCAGGFEASPELRARWLGPEWRRAMVRGNPFNTGEVLQIALEAGAAKYGDYTSCHSVAWDVGAPAEGGDRHLTNQYTRQSYPLGIVVDKHGQRFVDEGADFRNYTYAKYGAEILRRPDGVAFQLFDATTRPMLRPQEYESERVTQAVDDTMRGLAQQLGIDPDGLERTVKEFNAAVDRDVPFNPAIKDGKRADIDPPKRNWAQPLETPPYYGYAVTCGITFTFGGVRIDDQARVLRENGVPISGLYAAGELVGGLFSGNYPGGTGLTSGAVFGRMAGGRA